MELLCPVNIKITIMPSITIKTSPASEEKKIKLIEAFTKEASEILDYPPEFFFVYIDEYPTENIGVGGKTVKEIQTK